MLTAEPDDESALRERRCIATGKVLPEDELIRFVVSPDGEAVPDLNAELPGRGLWLSASRAAFAKAASRGDFAKAAKAKVKVAPDLADHVEKLLLMRLKADLGMARRAGQLEAGFDQVMRAFDKKIPPCLLISATDAAEDGRRKLLGAAKSRELRLKTVSVMTRDELGLALGKENVVHAAVRPGGLADRLILNAKRLAGLRGHASGTTTDITEGAGNAAPARNENTSRNESTL